MELILCRHQTVVAKHQKVFTPFSVDLTAFLQIKTHQFLNVDCGVSNQPTLALKVYISLKVLK